MFKQLLALLIFPLIWMCVMLGYYIVRYWNNEEIDDE